MDVKPSGFRGRGAGANPPNRFHPLTVLRDEDYDPAEDPKPSTIFLKDTARSIISCNDSPDVAAELTLNPYRGCEHGCIYCYARPTHEFLDFSSGLDFETRILVKTEAPELLRKELSRAKWQPKAIAFSGVTDCYQPVERRLQLTRRCLQVLGEFLNPCTIITKNYLVTRDIDILGQLARHQAVSVCLSITTLDADLAAKMEPRTSVPRRRLGAIRTLRDAGVPVGVMVAPVIPGLTDHEAPAILQAARNAGAQFAGHQIVRLPYSVAELFVDWLERHYPDRKGKVLSQIRQMRGGELNDSRFGKRMRGQGLFAEHFHKLFKVAARREGIDGGWPEISTASFRRPGGQGELF